MKLTLLQDGEIFATFNWQKDKWAIFTENATILNWWKSYTDFFEGFAAIFEWESIGYDVLITDWADWDQFKDEFKRLFKSDEPSLQDYHKIIKHFTTNSLYKSRIYLKPDEKPPEGIRVQRGPRGGLYYEEEKVVPKRPLAGRSLAIKPLVELSLKLSDIPEIKSFYAKYSSEKTAFGQLMACYDAWEWFKKNKAKLSDEQQKAFSRMHAKLNGPVRKILINEIDASQERKEPEVDYAKKYHFYPEAFGCTENELPLVSDLIMSGVPINKLSKIDNKYKISLECDPKKNESFFKFLSEKKIFDWKLYYTRNGHRKEAYKDKEKPDLISRLKIGIIPAPGDELHMNTSTGKYILNAIKYSINFNIEFTATKQELKQIQIDHFESKVPLDIYINDVYTTYNDAEIGTEKTAESWAIGWLSDTGGFSGALARLALGIKDHFSLIEANAVSFAGAQPSPSQSFNSLKIWTSGYSEDKIKWLNHLKKSFSGFKRLHKDTQSFLKTDKKYKKKDTITIYRGIGIHTNRRIFDGKFEESEVWVPPISSWTESPKIAKSFAQEADGNVLTAEVPKSWVLAHWKTSPGYQQGGFYNPVTKQYKLKTQKEVTIISPENKIKCSKIVHWSEMEE